MNSVQLFADHQKKVTTIPMDYECILNNQSEPNINELSLSHHKVMCGCDNECGEQVFKTVCGKDATCCMLGKELGSEEVCDTKLKQKKAENSKQNCGVVIDYGESSGCDEGENFNNDFIDIKSNDTTPETGIRYFKPCEDSGSRNSSPTEEESAFTFIEHTAQHLKTDNSATVEKTNDGLVFLGSKNCVSEQNISSVRDEFCLELNSCLLTGVSRKAQEQENREISYIDNNSTLLQSSYGLLDKTDPSRVTVNNSVPLEQKQKSKNSLDTDQAQCNYSYSAINPVTSPSLLSDGKSSLSESLQISDNIKIKVGVSCSILTPTSNQRNTVTEELHSLMAPTLQCSVSPNATSCELDLVTSECDSVLTNEKYVSADDILNLDNLSEDEENIFGQQYFEEDEEKQQETLDNIELILSNIPGTSIKHSLTPADVGHEADSKPQEPLATTQNSSALEFNTTQLITSSQNHILSHPNSFPNRKHIRSILNTVNCRLKTDVYSEEDVNSIADKMSVVLKGSRKRSYSSNSLNTPANHLTSPASHLVKKPCLVASCTTKGFRNSVKESLMDMDATSSYSTTPEQTNKIRQEQDAILLCKICDTSNPSTRSTRCRNSHIICQSCLEDEIRLVMASKKMHLSCPEKSCRAAIALDSLASILPSFVVELLKDNLSMKERKASAKAIKKMQELIICPRCSCPGLLNEWALHFVCATCNSSCCSYCKAAWSHYEHEGCFLLSSVGTECLKDISKLPLNWNMNITPFNKNFLQVDVPLSSSEGSMVVAYFAKTASMKCEVVQIFRIQNSKLWEKYVLKRKHVEEEIGAAELKERFLFHGTKAENIVNICAEGFDIRVPTANGAVLGKGIYFSISARYSERFAGKTGMLFLTRVICGWSQQGQRQMTRPQYHSTSRRMYDSCVDNISSPTMYTIFDNSQCYPEYLIKFTH